jgi:hypothetical protein
MTELNKVKTGQSFNPKASDWNAFVDAANAHKNRQHNIAKPQQFANSVNIVIVKNASDYNLPIYAPVVTASVAIKPKDDGRQFFTDRNHPTFNVVPVDLVDQPGTFLILTEPILAGKTGKAMLYGTMSVKLNISDEKHFCASGEYGTDKLVSCYDGPMKILYKESGTGEKWAVVSLNIDDESIVIRNNSGDDILAGDAVAVESFVNGCFDVTIPERDSMLNVYSYNGPPLPANCIGWINLGRLMRFALSGNKDLQPGMAIGTVENRWTMEKGKFGFVVIAVDGDYAWARYNGMTSVLKAVAEPTTTKINVEHVDSAGNPDGDTFTLDIIPDEEASE